MNAEDNSSPVVLFLGARIQPPALAFQLCNPLEARLDTPVTATKYEVASATVSRDYVTHAVPSLKPFGPHIAGAHTFFCPVPLQTSVTPSTQISLLPAV
jgi:hypothetical protein